MCGNGFVLANSRGAFLGMLLGGFVVLACKAKRHRQVFWGLTLVCLIGFVAAVDKTFIDRMHTIGDVAEQENEDADKSARSRMAIIDAQVRMAADYPMGVGHRGTAVLSADYMDRTWLTVKEGEDETQAARSSHNTFMSALVEQGVPGVVLFSSLVLWIVGVAFRVRHMGREPVDPELMSLSAALCGALMVVVGAGVATDYLMAEVQFWMLAALVSALKLAEGKDRPVAPAALPLRGLRQRPGEAGSAAPLAEHGSCVGAESGTMQR